MITPFDLHKEPSGRHYTTWVLSPWMLASSESAVRRWTSGDLIRTACRVTRGGTEETHSWHCWVPECSTAAVSGLADDLSSAMLKVDDALNRVLRGWGQAMSDVTWGALRDCEQECKALAKKYDLPIITAHQVKPAPRWLAYYEGPSTYNLGITLDAEGTMVTQVRGWGTLVSPNGCNLDEEAAGKVMDDLGQWMCDQLNTAWVRFRADLATKERETTDV